VLNFPPSEPLTRVMDRLHRGDVVGRRVYDAHGRMVGRVSDLWPSDGGGEPELLLLRLERWARRRYVPVEGTEWTDEEGIQLPWTWLDLDEAPDAEDHRWGDPAHVARAHWLLAGDD
jgi:hypothetical protein